MGDEKQIALQDFSFVITKASIDKTTGQMRWQAVASDTDKDLYDQSMSLQLFKDFIYRANNNVPAPEQFRSDYWKGGKPYLSVSHYPDFNGEGSAGEVTSLFIDGNRLKAKGVCYDTPLGNAAFSAIRRSVVEKSAGDTPVRISIGFLDFKHAHDGMIFDRKGIYDICPMCSKSRKNVVFLSGQLLHLALTRVPVNTRTDIEAEVNKSMEIKTMQEDAASIIGDDEAKKLQELSQTMVGKSEALVIKSLDEINPDDYADVAIDFEIPADELELFDAEVTKAAARKDVTPADKKAAEKKYGNVKFADEKNKKYPVDTADHVKAAWDYINHKENAAKYSPEDVKSMKRTILAAWKEKINKDGPPSVAKKIKAVVVEKQNSDEVGDAGSAMQTQPYNGATSFDDVDAFMKAQNQLSQAYDTWFTANTLVSNVFQNNDIKDKSAAISSILKEAQSRMETKSMVTLSKIEKLLSAATDMAAKDQNYSKPQNLADEVDDPATPGTYEGDKGESIGLNIANIPSFDEAIKRLRQKMDEVLSSDMDTDSIFKEVQFPLDLLGESIKTAVNSRKATQPAGGNNVPSVMAGGVNEDSLVRAFSKAIQPLSEQIGLLVQTQSQARSVNVEGSPRHETVPQRRAIVIPQNSVMNTPVTKSSNPKLTELIRKSVGLDNTRML